MSDDTNQLHNAGAEADDAALDRLLASAVWREPDGHAVRRLTRTVAGQRRRRLWIGRPLAATAAAAAVMVAGVCWIGWPGARPAGTASSPLAARPPVERPTTTPSSPNAGENSPVRSTIGREPTIAERMILLAASERTASNTRPPMPRASAAPAAVAAASLADVADRAGVRRTAREILFQPSRPSNESREQRAAARLAAVATPGDWPLVRGFLDRPRTRSVMVRALVARRDGTAIDLLLRGVLDPSIQPGVLAALKASPDLPTASLVAKFDSPRMDERWAAAMALGRCADADILARLAGMAERGEKRRESIAALVASDMPAARALLMRMSRTRETAPHVAPAREAIAVRLMRETIQPCFPALKS